MPRKPVRPLAPKDDEWDTLPFHVHLQEESAGVHSGSATATDLPPEKFFKWFWGRKLQGCLSPAIAGSILEPSEGAISVGMKLPFLVYRTERT